jgi:hypothetical protein
VNHTESNAKSTSISKSGLFATLRARLRGAKGSGAPLLASTGLLGLAVAALLALTASPAAAAEVCPNEAIRESQGTFAKALPDCRAYELVSPGSNPRIGSNGAAQGSPQASTTGNRFAYESFYPAADAPTSNFFYLSTRGKEGWSTQPAAPQESPSASPAISCEPELNYTPDLSKSVLGNGFHTEPYCQSAEEELAPGAPSGYRNLFLREDPTAGPYRLVNLTPPSAVPANALFVAGSSDFSHIVFTDEAKLTNDAPAGASLYEWAAGAVHLLTVLPGGEPTEGGIVGTVVNGESSAQIQHAVSADGERVYFYSQGNLYLRQNAAQQPTESGECSPAEPEKACTVQIDESHGEGSSGGGRFDEASVDGSKVFFTDESKLTEGSTAEPGAPDLYEFDLARSPSERLSDLTVDASEPAHVLSGVQASEDGSYVYFVADGVLAVNKVKNGTAPEEEAQPGKPNLYLRHAGATTFVAGFEARELNELGELELQGQVSPNGGRLFVFRSRKPLTGYDNTPADPKECRDTAKTPAEPAPCAEIFRYDATTGQLSCASCGPEGSAPTGDTLLAPIRSSHTAAPSAAHQPRNVDETGSVFFETSNALVPSDENGVRDVYEYENGQVHLISSGVDPSGAAFYEASASGNDVFFVTGQALLPSDTNNNVSVYDARVEGGFSEPPPPPECEGEACRTGGTVRPGTSPAPTSSFAGPGNPKVTGCKQGFVRKHGRCLPRKHHHRSHKRTASHNRGGGK